MTTKLTISIDKEVIERSKAYAASQDRSLSDLIESYLRSLTAPGDKVIRPSSKLQALRGSFKAPADFDYKKILQEEKIKKHG